MVLLSSDDREAFLNYSALIESNKTTLISSFSSSMQALASRASGLTGRSMSVKNFDLKTSIIGVNRDVGIVEYSFLWTSFAKVENRRMILGDVFEGGFYLYENDTLAVTYPQEFYVKSVSPTPDVNSTFQFVWKGSFDFEQGQPSLVLEDRRTTIEVFLSRQNIPLGESVAITGHIEPALNAVTVTLKLLGPSGTRLVPLVTLADGTFGTNFTFDEVGQWDISAYFSEYQTYLPSVSETTRIVVTNDLLNMIYRNPLLIVLFATSFASIILAGYFLFRHGRRNIEYSIETTDYERVRSLVRESGGAMLQSRIRIATGFSAAKLSRLLSEMEQQGQVRRRRKGREKVVFLLNKRG
jgi:hypothetical protein